MTAQHDMEDPASRNPMTGPLARELGALLGWTETADHDVHSLLTAELARRP